MTVIVVLKVLFNNVFTSFFYLTCMSHQCLWYRVKMKPSNIAPQNTIKCFKEVKIDKWPDLSYSFLPIDCCIRINAKPDRLFSHRDLHSDRIHFKTFVLLAVYWSIWTSSWHRHQSSAIFLTAASTMLNNVFNILQEGLMKNISHATILLLKMRAEIYWYTSIHCLHMNTRVFDQNQDSFWQCTHP